MPFIDFVISNPGHHVAMALPVLTQLKSQGDYTCRVISLCELRGFASPIAQFHEADEFICVPSQKFRSSPSTGKQKGGAWSKYIRVLLRDMSWHLLLKRPLAACFNKKPDLVVLPNDAAFPYERLVQQLHARQIPFLLLQEGIRFPLPSDQEQVRYGGGGATAVAAWGETSAAYFQAQGVSADSIFCTGSPRFDQIAATDWEIEAERLKTLLCLGKNNLLLLTNPIDDQGFCTTAEKLKLIGNFVSGIAPLFADPDFCLVIKLHAREAVADYEAQMADFPFAERILMLEQAPLYPLFILSQAAVILASTVGLEALLFGLPLGVLEIPGFGFVHDYVHYNAAVGISWADPIDSQVKALLTDKDRATTGYLEASLATQTEAVQHVVALIKKLV